MLGGSETILLRPLVPIVYKLAEVEGAHEKNGLCIDAQGKKLEYVSMNHSVSCKAIRALYASGVDCVMYKAPIRQSLQGIHQWKAQHTKRNLQ